MEQEKEILYKMRNVATELLLTFYQTKTIVDEIDNDVNSNENNYFEENQEIFHRFQQIINEVNIHHLSFLLQDFKCYVDFKLENCCEHVWINDDIDIDPDRSQRIVYCSKCGISKK